VRGLDRKDSTGIRIRSNAARRTPIPAASSRRSRRAWAFHAEEAAVAVVVGRSSPALQSAARPSPVEDSQTLALMTAPWRREDAKS